MLGNRAFFIAVALGLGLLIVPVRPASAEFFGCNDQHPARISYSSHSYSSRVYTPHSYSSHEFAAQRRSAAVYRRSNDPFTAFRNSLRR